MTTPLAPPAIDSDRPPAPRSEILAVAVGSALLASLVLLATGHAREGNDLDWAHFGLALAGSGALLGFAIAAYALVKDPTRRSDVVAWPAAFGALAEGAVVGTAIGEEQVAPYLIGAVILGVAAVGLVFVRRPALVIAGLVGSAAIFFAAFADVVGDDLFDKRDPGIYLGAAITCFLLVATLICWRLPGRELTTVVLGAVGIVAQLVAVYVIVVVGLFAVAFTEFDESESGPPFSPPSSLSMEDDLCADLMPEIDFDADTPPDFESEEFRAYDECVQDHFTSVIDEEPLVDDSSMGMFGPDEDEPFGNPFENDAWWMLAFVAVQGLLWAFLHRLTGNVGYRVLIATNLVLAVPIVLQVVAAQDPVWWEAGLGVLGLAVLGYAGWRATTSITQAAPGVPEPELPDLP